ncbi:MAG: calcium/sodium antiporter [Paludibacteraceae bacterium]|nr:calcium/sodium antiporter [Paludibacteraceae bacterium]
MIDAFEQLIVLNSWTMALAIIIGFVLLIYGADWLVDGASALAKRFGVSSLVIGLTVVAFGTSMPEFIVSTLAAIEHNTEIAITNILGSNAINTFIILGFTALIYPVKSKKSSRNFDIPISLLAGLLVLFFVTYTPPQTWSWSSWGMFSLNNGAITTTGGIILLVIFVIFMWHSFHFSKENSDETEEIKPMPIWKMLLLILVGLCGLILGGELVVRGATGVAHVLGVSDAVIGLTVVALGTSLPELATSCIAAAKHNSDLALGNVIGSNIFNVFFILGVGAVINPLPTYPGLWLDATMVVLSSLMVMAFVYCTKQHEIKRWHGALMVLVYALYLTYRLICL